jgi:glycosyltransferase involved in cell wall biosynthesis
VNAVTFVVYEGIAHNDVVKSQVVGLARELARHGVDCTLLVFERLDRWVRGHREARALMAADPDLRVRIRVLPRLHGGLGMRGSSLLLRFLLTGAEEVVHCRGAKACAIVLDALGGSHKCAVVGDFRGAEPEEAVDLRMRGIAAERSQTADSEQLNEYLSAIERRAVCGVDRVLCVSKALAAHYEHKYSLEVGHASVVHCGASPTCRFSSTARERIRAELGIDDEVVLCHLGRLSAVHRPDLLASLVSRVAERLARPVVLLLITHDSQGASTLEAALDGSVRVLTRSAPQQARIDEYLSAADVGLLLLDSAFRNRVSFPVKYGEYACCGLPVMITPYSADPAAYVRESGMGVLVSHDADDTWRVEWPSGEGVADAVERLANTSPEARLLGGERAAPLMRFDYTSDAVIQAYIDATAQRKDVSG